LTGNERLNWFWQWERELWQLWTTKEVPETKTPLSCTREAVLRWDGISRRMERDLSNKIQQRTQSGQFRSFSSELLHEMSVALWVRIAMLTSYLK